MFAAQPFCKKSSYPIPLDIRTALGRLGIESEIRRQICCPECFALYDINDTTATICTDKAAPSSRSCGTALRNKSGQPVRYFSTQSLRTWISAFVQRPEIDAALRQTSSSSSSIPEGDIRKSSHWQKIRENDQVFLHGPGRLAFSLFVDWFNPLSNKAAGESQTSTLDTSESGIAC